MLWAWLGMDACLHPLEATLRESNRIGVVLHTRLGSTKLVRFGCAYACMACTCRQFDSWCRTVVIPSCNRAGWFWGRPCAVRHGR